MAGRRWSRSPGDEPGWDDAMRSAVQHESVEVLRHQLEVERENKAAMERSDFFWSLAIVAGSFGFGLGVGALELQRAPKWLKRRIKGRRS